MRWVRLKHLMLDTDEDMDSDELKFNKKKLKKTIEQLHVKDLSILQI